MNLKALRLNKSLFAALLGLGLFTSTNAKDLDHQLKNVLGVSKSLPQDFSINASITTRLTDNMGNFSQYFTDVSLRYGYKYFDVGTGHRLMMKRQDDDTFESEHRWISFVSAKYKKKRLKTSLRFRIENRTENNPFVPGDYNKTNLRYRWDVGYKIKKTPYTPFASIELFNKNKEKNGYEINQSRLKGGVVFKIKKLNMNLETSLAYQREHATDKPDKELIYQVSSKFKF